MPKMKTKKSAAKRFRITGTGKIRRKRMNHRHILTKKSKNTKRKHLRPAFVSKADYRRIGRLLCIA